MPLSFAPLEGITGWVYRRAHRESFPGIDTYYAPFWAPTGDSPLTGRGLTDVLPEHNEGIPLIPQLLTNKAEDFLSAARALYSLGYDTVNLNLGCPSGTVFSKRKGAGFLALPEALNEFFQTVFEANLPMKISVKTRIGVQDPEEWPKLLEIYDRYPLSLLIIHPRVREDHYRGTPRREAFQYAEKHTKLPLCYNGDLFRAEDCLAFPKDSHLMLGRGLVANPALAREVQGGPPLSKSELRAFHDRLVEEYREILYGDRPVLGKMKEIWFYQSFLFAGIEKPLKQLRKAKSLSEYKIAVDAIYRDGDFRGKQA